MGNVKSSSHDVFTTSCKVEFFSLRPRNLLGNKSVRKKKNQKTARESGRIHDKLEKNQAQRERSSKWISFNFFPRDSKVSFNFEFEGCFSIHKAPELVMPPVLSASCSLLTGRTRRSNARNKMWRSSEWALQMEKRREIALIFHADWFDSVSADTTPKSLTSYVFFEWAREAIAMSNRCIQIQIPDYRQKTQLSWIT